MLPVTILGTPRSSYVRTVVLLCEEKLLGYRLEPSAPHSDEVRELNPLGKIPVLRHEGHTLFETLAITLYLNERFPGPDLVPSEPLARAYMLQWISVITSELYGVYVPGWLLPRLGIRQRPEDEVVANKARLRALMLPFELSLEHKGYLVGEELSVADLFLYPLVDYGLQLPDKEDVFSNFPQLSQWHQRLSLRESVMALTRL